MEEKILDFIKRRFKKDADWTDGNCLWFAMILKLRFPDLDVYYLPIQGHAICGYDGKYYDWNGKYEPEEAPIRLLDIANADYIWFARIVRDCMM